MMLNNKDLNYSYWETRDYFKKWDLIVIGSGIVGLSTAISFGQRNKRASILVLERGVLPKGASTKNAGFACFGSAGELLDDINNTNEQKVWETVKMRWQGLQILRKRLGDKNIRYEHNGGFELFYNREEFLKISAALHELNKNIQENTGLKNTYGITDSFKSQLPSLQGAVVNQHEGQLDTGRMMNALLKCARAAGVAVLNAVEVRDFEEKNNGVLVNTSAGQFECGHLAITTNGFAAELLHIKDVIPARAQVLITSPVKDLNLKGAFHVDKGYYYFRDLDGRILLGGARNIAANEEQTSKWDLNDTIQKHLESFLREKILPGASYKIEQRWTGIMGLGSEKQPIIKFTGNRVLAAVRMGGMGIAIGSLVGEEAARLLSE